MLCLCVERREVIDMRYNERRVERPTCDSCGKKTNGIVGLYREEGRWIARSGQVACEEGFKLPAYVVCEDCLDGLQRGGFFEASANVSFPDKE